MRLAVEDAWKICGSVVQDVTTIALDGLTAPFSKPRSEIPASRRRVK